MEQRTVGLQMQTQSQHVQYLWPAIPHRYRSNTIYRAISPASCRLVCHYRLLLKLVVGYCTIGGARGCDRSCEGSHVANIDRAIGLWSPPLVAHLLKIDLAIENLLRLIIARPLSIVRWYTTSLIAVALCDRNMRCYRTLPSGRTSAKVPPIARRRKRSIQCNWGMSILNYIVYRAIHRLMSSVLLLHSVNDQSIFCDF